MKETPQQMLDTDTLARSFFERISALAESGSKTAALALSECKLAASSAALAICAAVFLLLMLLMLWSMVLVMGYFVLRQAGFDALPSMGLLSMVQALACVVLVWTLNRLLHQMRFVNTRRAISNRLSDIS